MPLDAGLFQFGLCLLGRDKLPVLDVISTYAGDIEVLYALGVDSKLLIPRGRVIRANDQRGIGKVDQLTFHVLIVVEGDSYIGCKSRNGSGYASQQNKQKLFHNASGFEIRCKVNK